MAEWCQNKDCVKKKTQSQIRGSKGAKYYQSNKASEYYFGIACSQGCLHSIIRTNADLLIRTIGEIPKQVLPLDDAWYVEYNYNWNNERQESEYTYTLRNKLQGVKQPITREQAQTPEDIQNDHRYSTIDDTQAKELAISLGLAR